MKPKELSKKALTRKFLAACKKVGYKRISVGVVHKSIRSSTGWPFSPEDNVFSSPDRNLYGWPAIWSIVEKFGISRGCGNSQQMSIMGNKLKDGVYHLRDGKWVEVISLG